MSGSAPSSAATSAAARLAILSLAALLFTLFAGLGVWQLERRVWKLELIARVDARIHAAPVTAPGPNRWSGINAANDEYRHVQAIGEYVRMRDTLVQASTELGAGYWVLAPLQQVDGSLILINRGFIPAGQRDATLRDTRLPTGTVRVTGLLRLTEPDGTLMRANDPAHERWYSRDVAAVARARELGPVAPYFIDADADADANLGRSSNGRADDNSSGTAASTRSVDQPVAGLTVVQFRNNHLVYALTWFTLAVLSVVAGRVALRNAAQGGRAPTVDEGFVR